MLDNTNTMGKLEGEQGNDGGHVHLSSSNRSATSFSFPHL